MAMAEIVVEAGNRHGEGVFWNPADGRVWWTDIEGRRLWWYEPAGRRSGSIAMDDRVCCFAPRRSGGFICAFAQEFALLDANCRITDRIISFEPENPNSRTNDGRTDRQGRFVVGGMNEVTAAADSRVVRVDGNGSVSTLIEGVSCANSICFSPDGRSMFFADTPQRRIWTYAYDIGNGTAHSPHLLADFSGEPGLPDGSCVDADGCVWNAEWEGSRVVRIDARGHIDRIIDVPVLKPTCCAFGGPDLDTLYITSSRMGCTEKQLSEQPLAGALFAVKPGVRGIEDAPFAG